ncbi:cofilin/actin-depolymerizing factor-like protein, partial [Leptotrombidium deliense]
CPDNAEMKQKMLYLSSLENLKRYLVGTYKCINARDLDEASLEAVEQSLS